MNIKDRFLVGKTISLGYWDFFKKEKCIVCGLPIKEEEKDQTFYCPHCKNPAHKSHLLEWIKLKGTCPMCKKKLIRSDLDG